LPSKFEQILLAHLPSGLAWPKDKGSIPVLFAKLTAPWFEKIDQRIEELLLSLDPMTAPNLPRWERELGLTPAPGTSEKTRRDEAQGAYVGIKNFNGEYLKGAIERITGATAITFREYIPRGCGELTAGEPIEADWEIHIVEVNGVTLTREMFYRLKKLSQAHVLIIARNGQTVRPVWGSWTE
jgi:uncharacterized protein YmfQ (DUF2313 family)